jgi:putative aldouronate transport system substrate-binding protein
MPEFKAALQPKIRQISRGGIIMKKILVPVLFLFMGAAFAFGGGARGASGSASAVLKKGPRGSLPVTETETVLTVFVGSGSSPRTVTSFSLEDNEFTKKILKDTNIKLDVISANSAERRERMNILLSTNTYPEVIINNALTLNDVIYYASQGIFIAIDQYEPLSYPNIKAAFDEYPAAKDIVSGSDGKMYALPQVNDCLHCTYANGRMWYYMPWIRDNKLKVPETLDEFTEYLRYVKTHDMNKNGKSDEIPLAFNRDNTKNFVSYIAKAFMPFVVSGAYYGLGLSNRKVTEQYRDPDFRDALRYISGLYKEGLVMADSFTMTVDQFSGLTQNADPIVAVEGVSWYHNFNSQGTERWIDIFNLPPLKGPKGQRNAGNGDPWTIMGPSMAITNKCKDPEIAIALYNYFIDYENVLIGNMGPKGIGWDVADPGTISLLGGPADHKWLVSSGNQRINISWEQSNPMIRGTRYRLGFQSTTVEESKRWLGSGDPSLKDLLLQDVSYAEEMWYLTSLENQKYAMARDYFIPPVVFSDDDNARVTDINAVLEPYKEQAMVEFITGIRNINSDADWNTYLADLDRMGSRDLVTIIQKYIK